MSDDEFAATVNVDGLSREETVTVIEAILMRLWGPPIPKMERALLLGHLKKAYDYLAKWDPL